MNFKGSEPHCHNRRMLPLCSQGKKQHGALSKSYLLCLSYQERPERSMASRIDFLTVHCSVSSIPLTFSPPVFSHFFVLHLQSACLVFCSLLLFLPIFQTRCVQLLSVRLPDIRTGEKQRDTFRCILLPFPNIPEGN